MKLIKRNKIKENIAPKILLHFIASNAIIQLKVMTLKKLEGVISITSFHFET